ncbi:hypothetical protein ACVJBD_006203 [Rhizobium mongolense]
MIENRPPSKRADFDRPKIEGTSICAQHVAEPAGHQHIGGANEARARRLLDCLHLNVRHVVHVVAVLQQPEPARLVITGEHADSAEAPMVDIVVLHVIDEIRIAGKPRAEHRHTPGQRQHPLCKTMRRHQNLALRKTHRIPLLEDFRALDGAHLIGGQRAQIRIDQEHAGAPFDKIGRHNAVAVDHRDGIVASRVERRDGTEAGGQRIAFARPWNADDFQPERQAVAIHYFGKATNEALVADFNDRADDRCTGGRIGCRDESAAIDLGGGRGIDPEARNQEVGMPQPLRLRCRFRHSTHRREPDEPEPDTAQQMKQSPRPTPQPDDADHQCGVACLLVECLLRQQRCTQSQQEDENDMLEDSQHQGLPDETFVVHA